MEKANRDKVDSNSQHSCNRIVAIPIRVKNNVCKRVRSEQLQCKIDFALPNKRHVKEFGARSVNFGVYDPPFNDSREKAI